MGSSGQQEDTRPSMVTTVRAVVSTVALLSVPVCGTRLYLRKFILKAFGIDDYLVIVALVLSIGFAVLSIIITFYGIGYHQDTVPEEKLPTMQLVIYVSLCTYLFVATAVKTSLTVFIMRIFPKKNIPTHWTRDNRVPCRLNNIGRIPAYIPMQTRPRRICSNGHEQGLLLKRNLIRNNNVPTGIDVPGRHGTLACIAALVRLPTLKYQNDSADYTHSASKSMIWMNIEFNVGLIVGSLPSLAKIPMLKSLLNPNHSQNLSGSISNNALSRRSNGQGGHQLRASTWDQKFLRRESRAGNESRERMAKTPESNRM